MKKLILLTLVTLFVTGCASVDQYTYETLSEKFKTDFIIYIVDNELIELSDQNKLNKITKSDYYLFTADSCYNILSIEGNKIHTTNNLTNFIIQYRINIYNSDTYYIQNNLIAASEHRVQGAKWETEYDANGNIKKIKYRDNEFKVQKFKNGKGYYKLYGYYNSPAVRQAKKDQEAKATKSKSNATRKKGSNKNKKNQTTIIYEEGNIEDNKKVGEWKYYTTKNDFKTVNHTKQENIDVRLPYNFIPKNKK